MTEAASSMQVALADLKQRRRHIDDAIASMETILREVYGIETASVASTPVPASHAARPSLAARRQAAIDNLSVNASRADRVRAAFAGQPDRVWTAEAVVEHLGEPADDMVLKAMHSLFSRLAKNGEIHKVGRGQYRNGPAPTPTNASAPDLQSGAEVQEEPSEGSPEEEGGGRDESSTPLEDGSRGDHRSP